VLDQLTKRGRVAGVQALKEVRTLVDSGFNLFVGSLPCHTTTLQVCGRLALSVRDASGSSQIWAAAATTGSHPRSCSPLQ
jgi:hypothetical protein